LDVWRAAAHRTRSLAAHGPQEVGRGAARPPHRQGNKHVIAIKKSGDTINSIMSVIIEEQTSIRTG
jgi:hypothetical protein